MLLRLGIRSFQNTWYLLNQASFRTGQQRMYHHLHRLHTNHSLAAYSAMVPLKSFAQCSFDSSFFTPHIIISERLKSHLIDIQEAVSKPATSMRHASSCSYFCVPHHRLQTHAYSPFFFFFMYVLRLLAICLLLLSRNPIPQVLKTQTRIILKTMDAHWNCKI